MKATWILAWFLVMGAMVGAIRAAVPEEGKWLINYPVPEDVRTVTVTLAYKWWDPKIDGDVPSKRVLLTATLVKIAPGQKSLPIQVQLTQGKSVVIVDKQVFAGKGFPVDAFWSNSAPKPNADGFYVLASKPTDPKDPGGESSAWIELEIDPQP